MNSQASEYLSFFLKAASVSKTFHQSEGFSLGVFRNIHEERVSNLQWGQIKRQWAARNKSEDSKSPGSGSGDHRPHPWFSLYLRYRCSWLATGTCHWWGNLTPPWWAVGLSSACDERAWDDSRSWAAGERWWWGREPEEGSHLQEQNRDINRKLVQQIMTLKEQEVCMNANHNVHVVSYLTLGLDVLPLLETVWRWGRHCLLGSGRLLGQLQEKYKYSLALETFSS